jgi:hypothetical protein
MTETVVCMRRNSAAEGRKVSDINNVAVSPLHEKNYFPLFFAHDSTDKV